MGKLLALWRLFQKGNEVSDPAKWKNGQITVNAIGAVLLGAVELARAFGYEVPITEAQSLAIGGGVIAVVNIVLTVITSARVGLPAKDPPAPEAGGLGNDPRGPLGGS